MIARLIETIGDSLPESLARHIPVKAFSFEDFSQKIDLQGVTDISVDPRTEVVSKAPLGFPSLLNIADRTYTTVYTGTSVHGRKVVWVETHEKLLNSSVADKSQRNITSLHGLITARYRLECLRREHSINTNLINPNSGKPFNEELMLLMENEAKKFHLKPYPLPSTESK